MEKTKKLKLLGRAATERSDIVGTLFILASPLHYPHPHLSLSLCLSLSLSHTHTHTHTHTDCLDPDAPSREQRTVEPQDLDEETLLMRGVWRLLRAGHLGSAVRLCQYYEQHWRAA